MGNQEAHMEQEALQAFYTARGFDFRLKRFDQELHPIYLARIPGGDTATELWHRLRALSDETGFWPLLTHQRLGNGDGDPWFLEGADDLETAAWLARAATLDPAAYFADRAGDLPDPDDEDDEWAEFAEEAGMPAPSYGPQTGLLSVRDSLSREPYPFMDLVLVPTRRGYEAPAWLGFGGWNACPEPEWQVAILRGWSERFGAEPALLNGDVLEMAVSRPPRDEAAALSLAREQYLFCDDIVHQGVMTIDNLKTCLIDSPYWYFWWD